MRRSVASTTRSRPAQLRRSLLRGPLAAVLALLCFGAIDARPAAAAPAVEVALERGIVYATPGGEALRLDAYRPRVEGPVPAVIVIHGGSWRGGSRRQLARHARALAEAGIAAFAIEYRLAPRHPWPAQIHDCKAAVAWVRERADALGIDPERIGAFGYSAGGHLAALLALTGPEDGLEGYAAGGASTRVQAVVAGGAPFDIERLVPARSNLLAYWLGGTRLERPEVYRAASPLSYARPDAPPLLAFHGTLDLLVPIAGAARMVARLRGHGVPAQLVPVPFAGHGGAPTHLPTLNRSVAFLREHLQAPRIARF